MRSSLVPFALALALVACRSSKPPPATDTQEAPPPATQAPAKAPLTGELVTVGASQAVFNAPAGWQRYTVGDWTRFKAPDNGARLAFVTFDKPNESTRRIGEIAEQFELSEITWGEPRLEPLGKDQMNARAADSRSCTLKSGGPCRMWFATVNPGTPEQVLIVYLVASSRAEKEIPKARAAVQSLRHAGS